MTPGRLGTAALSCHLFLFGQELSLLWVTVRVCLDLVKKGVDGVGHLTDSRHVLLPIDVYQVVPDSFGLLDDLLIVVELTSDRLIHGQGDDLVFVAAESVLFLLPVHSLLF